MNVTRIRGNGAGRQLKRSILNCVESKHKTRVARNSAKLGVSATGLALTGLLLTGSIIYAWVGGIAAVMTGNNILEYLHHNKKTKMAKKDIDKQMDSPVLKPIVEKYMNKFGVNKEQVVNNMHNNALYY